MDWRVVSDGVYGGVYYINARSGEVLLRAPDKWTRAGGGGGGAGSGSGTSSWERAYDPTGRLYFYDPVTGATSLVDPSDAAATGAWASADGASARIAAANAPPPPASPPGRGGGGGGSGSPMLRGGGATGSPAASPGPPRAIAELIRHTADAVGADASGAMPARNWLVFSDDASGALYYFNVVDGRCVCVCARARVCVLVFVCVLWWGSVVFVSLCAMYFCACTFMCVYAVCVCIYMCVFVWVWVYRLCAYPDSLVLICPRAV
jgi:hypothetical protein